tara:strand:+ start:79 stop:384 length:306 start_codon:yes stop_codon:yes gene_type:complete
MAVESGEMRLEFLQDWGDSSATFTDTSAGSSSTITAMLKRDYFEEVAGESTVESSAPVAIVRSADVTNVAHDDTLAISGTTYTVVEVMPDNEGMTQLRLKT